MYIYIYVCVCVHISSKAEVSQIHPCGSIISWPCTLFAPTWGSTSGSASRPQRMREIRGLDEVLTSSTIFPWKFITFSHVMNIMKNQRRASTGKMFKRWNWDYVKWHVQGIFRSFPSFWGFLSGFLWVDSHVWLVQIGSLIAEKPHLLPWNHLKHGGSMSKTWLRGKVQENRISSFHGKMEKQRKQKT